MLTPPLVPTQLWDSGAIQDYYGLIVIIWHTFFLSSFCSLFFSAFYSSLCSFLFSVWWPGASLLGRWDSNQSGPPRGASKHRAPRSLIAPGQADLPLQHMFTERAAPTCSPASSACESLSGTDGGLRSLNFEEDHMDKPVGATRSAFVWFFDML